MGRYCIICGRDRPNEAFSGRGAGARTCKKCRTMPKAERQRIIDEVFLTRALEQKSISEKNVASFNEMRQRYPDSLGEMAAVMAELGMVHPKKKNRYGFLYHKRRDLFDRMVRLQMIEGWSQQETEDAEEEQAFGDNIYWPDFSENMKFCDDDSIEYLFERESENDVPF